MIDFGRILPNQNLSRLIYFDVDQDFNINNCKTLTAGRISAGPYESVDGPGVAKPGRKAYRLKLRVQCGEELGHQNAEVRIAGPDGGTIASLPITWTVGSSMDVVPKTLFFSGCSVNSSIEASFMIRVQDGALPSIGAVRSDGEPVSFEANPVGDLEVMATMLTVRIPLGAKPGIEEHRLTVEASEPGRILAVVPVTAIVE